MENWKVLEKGGLSGVGGNQVTLRCLILVFYVAGGDDWGFAPSPSREHVPCTLSPLRGGLKWLGWNQVALRCLILVFYVGHG